MKHSRLRRGYTTGTCAAAAARAAVLMLQGRAVLHEITIETPAGIDLALPLTEATIAGETASCAVVKDAGDDPDVTHGISVVAEVRRRHEPGITITGGAGVGVVTKPGLAVPVGTAAINPGPRRQIFEAVAGVLAPGSGVEVVISVPEGREVAKRTMNSRLGIQGGISILGTTGIVEPMSEEALKQSLVPQITMGLALGYRVLVLTPGRMGQRITTEMYGVPAEAVALTSNYIGFMLETCAELGVPAVILFGNIGKLVKVAAGIFNTHSRVADGRMETLAALAAGCGATAGVVQDILDCATTGAAMEIIDQHNLGAVYRLAARRAAGRCNQLVGGRLTVGVVMCNLAGAVLAADQRAREVWREAGWPQFGSLA